MTWHGRYLILAAALGLAACATSQESAQVYDQKSETYSSHATQSASAQNLSGQNLSGLPEVFSGVICPDGAIERADGSCIKAGSAASTYRRIESPPRNGNRVLASTARVSAASGNYKVVSGDTVYSLSRRLCVSIDEIQSRNGLDSDYGIKIGQRLVLPSNRC